MKALMLGLLLGVVLLMGCTQSTGTAGSHKVSDLQAMVLQQNDVPGMTKVASETGLLTDALAYSEGNATHANELTQNGWIASYASVYEVREGTVQTKYIWVAISLYNQSVLPANYFKETVAETRDNNYTILPAAFGEDSILMKKIVTRYTGTFTVYEARFYKGDVYVNFMASATPRSISDEEVITYLRTVEGRT